MASAAPPASYLIVPGEPPARGGADEVGNKAWNLMQMTAAGLPVPPAFVLSTEWCRAWRAGSLEGDVLLHGLRAGITRLEAATGLGFGSPRRPLLVSVRSGARASMPGMLETVLDVGLNEETVEGLIRHTGNPRLAWDSFRRFTESYGTVVVGISPHRFGEITDAALAVHGARSAAELDHRALRALTLANLEAYRTAGAAFPVDPHLQLAEAARAVLRSWDAPKATLYRSLQGLDDAGGTAITVQTMVFGNAGGASGSGVGFTRNPSTGGRELYVDFVFDSQGEDIVGGRHVPVGGERLQRILPAIWSELETTRDRLEALFRDVQDFEFTIEAGRLALLQTRRAKRSPWAAVRIAVELVHEGLISSDEGLAQLEGIDLDAVVRTRFVPPLPPPLAHATAAGVGVASGAISLDAASVRLLAESGNPVVLVRREMVTEDIAAIEPAEAILTARGGRTSHAAVVARSLGKLCLVGCSELTIDEQRRTCRIGDREFSQGDEISLDGSDGAVYPGRLVRENERPIEALAEIASWRRQSTGARGVNPASA